MTDLRSYVTSGSQQSTSSGSVYSFSGPSMEDVNKALSILGIAPLSKKLPLRNRQAYKEKRLDADLKILDKLYTRILELEDFEDTKEETCEEMPQIPGSFSENLLNEARFLYQNSSDPRRKLQFLVLASKDWTVPQVANFFQCSPKLARHAKDLRLTVGLCPPPKSKRMRTLDEELIWAVTEFYRCDEISTVIGGMKETISVHGVVRPKRLTLCNISEAHSLFLADNPDKKVGRSTFARLRPKDVIFPGGWESHIMSLCKYCQNLKLMLAVKNIGDIELLLRYSSCDLQNETCMTGECQDCGELDELSEYLDDSLKPDAVKTVRYNQWVTRGKCEFETKLSSEVEYVERIKNYVKSNFKSHWFAKKQQQNYLKKLPLELPNDEIIILMDFAENYQFVIQEEVASHYFNRYGCSLHNLVIYYRNSEGNVAHKSFCCISDSNVHDFSYVFHSISVVLREFSNILKSTDLKKIHYVTDGAAQHYKNRSAMWFLAHHEVVFGCSAEWHFHATAHGKGPCDGVGATIKRLCRIHSLRQSHSSDKNINSARDMKQWADEKCPEVKVLLLDNNNLENNRRIIEEVKSEARLIKGISHFHNFSLKDVGLLCCKVTSNSIIESTVSVSRSVKNSERLA